MPNITALLMKPYIFFLDIDGTLIQPNQKSNSDLLPNTIKKLSQKGHLFGLNSNRAVEDIVDIYQLFGLNGPIILENGVYYKKTLDAPEILLIESPAKLQKLTMGALSAYVNTLEPEVHYECTDTVDIIENEKYNEIPLGIYLNKFRKYTASIHVFRYGKRNLDAAQKITDYLQKYFNEKKMGIIVRVTSSFGNVILYPKDGSKKDAFTQLKSVYPDYKFAMIGDSLGDAETAEEIDFFYTVGNAPDKVKAIADLAASKPYTQGVIEVLEQI